MNTFAKIALGVLLSTAASQAAIYHVTIDTTSLSSSSAPYSLDFQLNSGDTLANNTATISNFVGLGTLGGSADTFGGVSGDLSGSVILADTDAFNEFFQSFTAGGVIQFDVTLSQNLDSGATPDSFSVAILDSSLANVTTDGLGNSLVQFDINSTSALTPTVGNGTGSFSGLTTTVVPEPSTTLLGAAGALLAFRRRRRAA